VSAIITFNRYGVTLTHLVEEIPDIDCRTTISISKRTKQDLSKLGEFGQSYDDIIKKLLLEKGETECL